MPIPKLTEIKGTKMPEWNLTPAQLAREKKEFAQAAQSLQAAQAVGRKTARKKGAKKAKKAGRKAASFPPTSLEAITHKDLMIDRSSLQVRLRDLVRVASLARRRKNQKDLTPTEWSAFINAINTIATSGALVPTYQQFVKVHVDAMNMSNPGAHQWGVHSMAGMPGRNFLAWHREYLAKIEARLRLANPLVTIPYWNWVQNRAIPPQLSNRADLRAWGITRGASFNPGNLPTQSHINSVNANSNFTAFQSALESPHNWVHNAVGGTMATSASPADPLFWLHHAFVDKIWADWQKTHTGAAAKPPNLTEVLKPSPIITRKVSDVLDIGALGYMYV